MLDRTTPAPPARAAVRGLLYLAAAIAFALALDPALSAVAALGRYLPAHDVTSDYAIAVAWSLALGVSILFWPVPPRDRVALVAVWALKCFVALGFMLAYEWNYPVLDAYNYFSAALEPSADWSAVGLGNGTENVNALSWLHARLLPASYHAMKVSYAMCGLVAVYLFYRAAVRATGREDGRILAVLALYPSILFWSSILGKDPLILLGIALYAYGVVAWKRGGRPAYLLWAILGALIAVYVRLWLGPILGAATFALTIVGVRGPVRRVLWCAAGVSVLAVAMRAFSSRFAIETLGDLVSTANYWSQGWAEGGSAQLLSSEFTGVGSMLLFLPIGMFTALFRPLPGEVTNAFGLLAGLENACTLSLLVVAFVRTRPRDFRDPLVLWAATLVVAWSAVYSFVSYQNLGTAVRFRLQILPVLLLLLLHLSRRRDGSAVVQAAKGDPR